MQLPNQKNLPLLALIVGRFGTQDAAARALGLKPCEINYIVHRKPTSARALDALTKTFGQSKIRRVLQQSQRPEG
jgi:hypothetical protein